MEVKKMEVIYDLLLDVNHGGSKQCIELKKNEANAKKMRIELCKGIEPVLIDRENTIAIIRGYKPDGKIIFNTATVTEESKIEYTLGTQDTSASGTSWYEVQLITDEAGERKILYTAQFKAVIDDTVVDDGKITSSDEFGKLTETILENQTWLKEKESSLNKWAEEQTEKIDTNEQEHIKLINDRTLNHKEKIILTNEDNTTTVPVEKYGGTYLEFTSRELPVDYSFLKIVNNSDHNVAAIYAINDDETKEYIGSVQAGFNPPKSGIIDMTNVKKYIIKVQGMGPFDADISQFEFTKMERAIYKNEIIQEMTGISENPVSATAVVDFVKKDAVRMLPKATISTPGVIRLAGGSETAAGKDYESAVTPCILKYILTTVGCWADDSMSDKSNGIAKNRVIKEYIDRAISTVKQFRIIKVDKLPTENIDSNAIYFIPKKNKADNDVFDEYMYINDKWELIGSTSIDLLDYYTCEETDRQIEDYCGQLEDLDSDIFGGNLVLTMNIMNKLIKQKAKIFVLEGNAEPTQTTSDYPDIKIGDICINQSYRMWICSYKHESATVWNELLTATSPYFSSNFYSKTNIDTMLEEYAKKTDYAKNDGTAGVVKVTNGIYGIKNIESGIIGTVKATSKEIKEQTNNFKVIVPSNLKEAVETIGGAIDELKTEDKSNYANAINEILSYATRTKSWRKVRTIVVPSDESLGQTINGVSYLRGSADTTATGTQICKVKFDSDEDGNIFAGRNITNVLIKSTPTEAMNINQGFLDYNGIKVMYMSNVKGSAGVRYYECPTDSMLLSGATGISNQYLTNRVHVNSIETVAFGGHERSSVLGEGTKLEVWAYGYWSGLEVSENAE